ncbi:MAG: hypothetical protein JNK65_03940, partial [Deltaproteobacteria bacterium]|nr:hypothetical protein [Deltaproteobacteria bacterium]
MTFLSSSGRFNSSESLLSRLSSSSLNDSELTQTQRMIDQSISTFAHEATNWQSLACMAMGSLFYRVGRLTTLSLAGTNPGLLQQGIRGSSYVIALASEVAAFEGSSRFLAHTTGHADSIQNSFEEGFRSSFVNFGALKIFGHLGAHHNFIIRNLLADAGMVAGHELTYRLGMTPQQEGSLLERMVQAQITNMQLSAGTSLMGILAPNIQATERALDHSLSSHAHSLETYRPHSQEMRPALALAEGFTGNISNSIRLPNESHAESIKSQPVYSMIVSVPGESSPGVGGSSHTSPTLPHSYTQILRDRSLAVPQNIVQETTRLLRVEWNQWKQGRGFQTALDQRIQHLFEIYTRFAIAHLGRESSSAIPFISDVYEISSAEYLAQHGEPLHPSDRNLFLHFLSTQPRRKNGEFGNERNTPEFTRTSFEQTQRQMGETQHRWENFLRDQLRTRSLSTTDRAFQFQRSLALMHFYVAELIQAGHFSSKGFSQTPFHLPSLENVLAASSHHPYPKECLEIFSAFISQEGHEALDLNSILQRQTLSHPSLAMEALPTRSASFLERSPEESWNQFLTRVGLSRGQLDVADLGVAGATIFGWGRVSEDGQTLTPPGDILNLLGLLTYVNQIHDHGIDPLDAIRMTLPSQTRFLQTDAQGNLIIRYPKVMEEIDYRHFHLSAFLRTHLQQSADAKDMDLARQWGVHESTVGEYRRGVVRRMKNETFELLAGNLLPAETTRDQREQFYNFLIFLRYRPYFDGLFEIQDQDGNALNARPPTPSRAKIILMPEEQALRPIDTSGRVRFEREPFASAVNGTVDLSLDLLDRRCREFEILGREFIEFPGGTLTLPLLEGVIRRFRTQHVEAFQTLSANQGLTGAIRPGELRNIQEFYREFFRQFERFYLHVRPEGSLQLGSSRIDFEIVPPTSELTRGVRMLSDRDTPNHFRALVVAEDLVENGRALSAVQLRDLLHLRVIESYLQEKGLWVESADTRNNDFLLTHFFEKAREDRSESLQEILNRFHEFKQRTSNWNPTLISPVEEATLHRITKGQLHLSNVQRRRLSWLEDLEHFIETRKLHSSREALLESWSYYLDHHANPHLQFNAETLRAGLENHPSNQNGLETHLLDFMATLGIPNGRQTASRAPSVQGISELLFSQYLGRLREMAPLSQKGVLPHDPVLFEELLEGILRRQPSFESQRDLILNQMLRMCDEYNQRQPRLRVHGVGAETTRVQWERPSLNEILTAQFFNTLDTSAHAQARRLLQIGLHHLEASRSEETHSEERIQQSYEAALETLLPIFGGELHSQVISYEIYEGAIRKVEQHLQSTRRLAELVESFVEREGFESGLENTRRLKSEIRNLFEDYLRAALLDSNPASAREMIASRLLERFLPYPSIRDEVMGGLLYILNQIPSHLAVHYRELREAFEMARDESANLDAFSQAFTTLASAGHPALAERNILDRRIQDLERLLSLLIAHQPYSLSSEISSHQESLIVKA